MSKRSTPEVERRAIQAFNNAIAAHNYAFRIFQTHEGFRKGIDSMDENIIQFIDCIREIVREVVSEQKGDNCVP